MLESACARRPCDLGEFSLEALDLCRGFLCTHGPARDTLFNRLDEIAGRFLDHTFEFCPPCRKLLIGQPRKSASFVSRGVVRFRHRTLSRTWRNRLKGM